MDNIGLEYFISVAENQSFTVAAKQCAVTQTAISQHIKNMEENLGFKLFNRSTRYVSLTPAGEVFYKDALKLIADYENAIVNGRNAAEGRLGKLVVAVPGYPEGELLAPRFQKFIQEFPKVRLFIHIVPCIEMPTLLKKKKIDVAIFWPYDFDKKLFDAKFISEYSMDLVCSPNGPLRDKKSAYIRELKNIKLSAVDFATMPYTKSAMAKQWKEIGMQLPDSPYSKEMRNIDEVAIAIGLDEKIGILVPRYIKSYAYPNLHYVQIKDKLRFSLYAVISRENYKQELVNFLSILMDNRIPLDY